MLVVEDDDFKYERILNVLLQSGVEDVERVTSVSEAIERLEERDVDVLILDMSLPGHPIRRGDVSPTSLLSGGIEVIMHMSVREIAAAVVIVTQYPEVEIENRLVPVRDVKKSIADECSFDVREVIYYMDRAKEWEELLVRAIKV